VATVRREERKRRERGEASRVFSKLLLRCLEALVGGVLALAPVSSAHAAWYDANWKYRKKLPIDYTKIPVTPSSFPALLSPTSDSNATAFGDLRRNTWA
jgi:hypothetical protein